MRVATGQVSDADTVEQIHRIIHSLVDERRQLKARNEDAVLLEANRIAIEYWRVALARHLQEPIRPQCA